MKHFNNLTPAEAERLAMLAEECGEVIQVVGKILRHGYESYHPNDLFNGHPKPGAENNRDLLANEVCDLLAVVQMMDADFNVGGGLDPDAAIAKKMRFAHHQS